MTIRVVYTAQPKFPATDQEPTAQRVQLNGFWVDYTGAVPVLADVAAFLAPSADEQRISAVKANARRQLLVTAIQNNDDVALIAAIGTRYPSLSGDALKAVVDIVLLIAGVIRA